MTRVYRKRWRMFQHKSKQHYKVMSSLDKLKKKISMNNCLNSKRGGS